MLRYAYVHVIYWKVVKSDRCCGSRLSQYNVGILKVKQILIEFIKTTFIFPVRNSFIHLNRFFGSYSDVIWLVGDGRSGTTWVSSIINSQSKARELFEPYHFEVLGTNQFAPYKYSTPATLSSELETIYDRIFSGKLLHRRADFGNLNIFYKGMVVKDIFISPSVFAIVSKYPNVKPVLLIRNPFAVVLSKHNKENAYWPTDLSVYINEPNLMKRLGPQIELYLANAQERQNFIEIQFIHWAMGNRILLQDFCQKTLHIIFYEDMKTEPSSELVKLKKFLGKRFSFVPTYVNNKTYSRPSRVVTNSQRVEHEYSIDYWKGLFKKEDFELGLEVLTLFEMDKLYTADGMPNRHEFRRFGFTV